jgi:hypothetical protein
MKKYSIALIAFFAIITCAFALKPSQHSGNKKQASLYWFVGATYTGRQNTHASEVTPSGCSDSGSLHCEDGYDDDDLVTSGDPYSGLKSGATINDFIRKS